MSGKTLNGFRKQGRLGKIFLILAICLLLVMSGVTYAYFTDSRKTEFVVKFTKVDIDGIDANLVGKAIPLADISDKAVTLDLTNTNPKNYIRVSIRFEYPETTGQGASVNEVSEEEANEIYLEALNAYVFPTASGDGYKWKYVDRFYYLVDNNDEFIEAHNAKYSFTTETLKYPSLMYYRLEQLSTYEEGGIVKLPFDEYTYDFAKTVKVHFDVQAVQSKALLESKKDTSITDFEYIRSIFANSFKDEETNATSLVWLDTATKNGESVLYGAKKLYPLKVTRGEAIFLPTAEEVETYPGYEIVGWYSADNPDLIYELGQRLEITQDTKLIAKYSEIGKPIIVNTVTDGETVKYLGIASYGQAFSDLGLTNPTRFGYIFTGWYTSADCTTLIGDNIESAEEEITIYAGWRKVKFTVEFYENSQGNAVSGIIPAQIYSYGDSINVSSVTYARAGYTFEGFSLTENGEIITGEVAIEDNFLDSGFMSKDGSVYNLYVEVYDCTVNLASEENFNIIFYAKWTAKDIVVTFNIGGGISSTTATFHFGDLYELPNQADFENLYDGYYFVGWYTGENGTGSAVNSSSKVYNANNHTIYAYWLIRQDYVYSVTYYKAEDGTEIETRQYQGLKDTIANATVINIDGRVYNATDSRNKISGELTEDGTLGLKLYYSKIQYTIIYEALNGIQCTTYQYGYMSDTVTLYDYAQITALNNNFNIDGQRLLNWQVKNTNILSNNSNQLELSKSNLEYIGLDIYGNGSEALNTTIYLVPVMSSQTYSITFMNGDQIISTEVVEYGANIATVAPEASKIGYNFICWTRDIENKNEYMLGSMPAYNLILYAFFKEKIYTVIYDFEGEFEQIQIQVAYGKTFKVLDNPYNKLGYIAGGWRLSANGAVNNTNITDGQGIAIRETNTHVILYDSSNTSKEYAKMPIDNSNEIELTAIWTLQTYTLTIYMDSTKTSVYKTYEGHIIGDVITDDLPMKAKYVFSGWTYNGTGKFSSLTPVENETTFTFTFGHADEIAYANWMQAYVNVTIVTDFVNDIKDETKAVYIGTPYNEIVPANPVKANFEFTGWFIGFSSVDFAGAIVAENRIDIANGYIGDVDCYIIALWTLSYNLSDDGTNATVEATSEYAKKTLYIPRYVNKITIDGETKYYETTENAVTKYEVTMIADNAFTDNTAIDTVILPDSSSMNISKEAFRGTTSLKTVAIKKNGEQDMQNNMANICPTDSNSWTLGYASFCGSGIENLKLTGAITINDPKINNEGYDGVFRGCASLEYVDMSGYTGTSIENRMFADCRALKTFITSPTITTIEEMAFYVNTTTAVTALKAFDFTYITDIEGQAFRGSSLENANLPNIVNIYNAFLGCSNLKTVTLGNSLTYIINGAFGYCTGITYFEMPLVVEQTNASGKIKDIINNASTGALFDLKLKVGNANAIEVTSQFAEPMQRIQNLYIGEGITILQWNAFSGCINLVKVELSSTVVTLSDACFNNCSKLSQINTENIENLGWNCNVFNGCTSLTQLDLSSATQIAPWTFKNCTGLTTLELPSIVTLCGLAFSGTSNLKTIILSGNTKPNFATRNTNQTTNWNDEGVAGRLLGSRVFENTNANILVPYLLYNTYYTDSNLTAYRDRIVGYYDLASFGTLPTTDISDNPDNLIWYASVEDAINDSNAINSSISVQAGRYYTKNLSVGYVLPFKGELSGGNITLTEYIGSGATVSLDNLPAKGYVDENGIVHKKNDGYPIIAIGANCFANAGTVREITIPNTIKTIENNAFSGATSLTTITFNGEVSSFGTNVFNGCQALTTVNLPSGITALPNGTFSGCSALVEIILPATVTTINADAFKNCLALKELRITATTNVAISANAITGSSITKGLGYITVQSNLRYNYVKTDGSLNAYANNVLGYSTANPLPTYPENTLNVSVFWTLDLDGESEQVASGIANATQSIYYTRGIRASYTVAFDKLLTNASITGTNPIIVYYGDTYGNSPTGANTFPICTYEGYEFGGWFQDLGSFEKLVTVSSIVDIMANHTLYAKWTPIKYQINYDLTGGFIPNGNTNPSFYTRQDAKFTLYNPTKIGYNFAGWTSEIHTSNTTTVSIDPSVTRRNLNFVAHWTLITYTVYLVVNDTFTTSINGNKYTDTVKYNTSGLTYGGGTYGNLGWSAETIDGVVNLKKTFNVESAEISIPILAISTFTFIGWNVNNTGYLTKNAVVNKGSVGNRTFVAEFEHINYSVKLDKQGGTNGNDTVTMYLNKELPNISTPTRAGYTFNGYYTATSGGTQYYTAQGTAYNNISWTQASITTLYAQWTANKYNLTLSANGGYFTIDGSTVISTTITNGVTYGSAYGSAVTTYTPVYNGNVFAGWYTSATGGSQVTQNTIFSNPGNYTIYAHWTSNRYTVKFDSNGGSSIANVTNLAYGTSIDLTTPTKTGYTFAGWIPTYTINGKTYVQVFYHDNRARQVLFDTPEHAQSYNQMDMFSLLKDMETLKAGNTSNNYWYMLKYEDSATQYNEWKQTANPLTTYVANVDGSAFAPGYSAEHIDWTGHYWGGLTLQNSSANTKNKTLLSGSVGHSNYFYAIGSYSSYTNGIPSWNSTAKGVSLLMYIDNFNANFGTLSQMNCTTDSKFYVGNFDKNLVPAGGTITLKALWRANTYTVAYNGNGSTSGSMANTTHTYGVAQNLRANGFSRTGYSFAGWATSSGGGVVYSNSASVLNLSSTQGAKVTLYAKWTPIKYTIAFNSNGGTGTMTNITNCEYGKTYTLTDNGFSRSGYTFNGWNTVANGTGNAYSNRASVSNLTTNAGTVTLYAQWQGIQYTVTFNNNGKGGTPPANKTVTYGSAYGTLGSMDNITGYTFSGWSTTTSGSPVITNTSIVSTVGNHTLYAIWTANKYTITLDRQSGTGGTTSVTATYASAMPTATAPSRVGYTFNGYYTATNGGGTQYYTSTMASARNWDKTSNTTLYAYWTIIIYTITLDRQSGTGGSTAIYAKYGLGYYSNSAGTTAITAITKPTRTGYTFGGYYTATNGGGTQRINDSGTITASNTTFTANATLYAKWTANKYTITLDRQSGTGGTTSVTATYASAMPTATAPSRVGYKFNGYYTATNGGGTQYYTSAMASARNWDKTSNTTLYAYWTLGIYTITLNQQSGSGGSTVIYEKYSTGFYSNSTCTTVATSITKPTRTGYTFGGYYTSTNGGGSQRINSSGSITASNTTFTANTTLYAKWTANTYYVELNNNFDSTNLSTYNDYGYNNISGGWSTIGGSRRFTATSNSVNQYSGPHINGPHNVMSNGQTYRILIRAYMNHPKTIPVRFEADSTNNIVNMNLTTTAQTFILNVTYSSRTQYRGLLFYASNWATGDVFTIDSIVVYKQVTYDSVYGVLPNDLNQTNHDDLRLTRTGYTFNEWYTAATGGTRITVNSIVKVTSDTKIYAHWTLDIYRIELDRQGGTGGDVDMYQKYATGFCWMPTGSMPITSISVPKRTEYIFQGYYTATNGGGLQIIDSSGKIVASNTTFTANTTIYAYWKGQYNIFVNSLTIGQNMKTEWQTNSVFQSASGNITYNSGSEPYNYISLTGVGGWENVYTRINVVAGTWYTIAFDYTANYQTTGGNVQLQIIKPSGNDYVPNDDGYQNGRTISAIQLPSTGGDWRYAEIGFSSDATIGHLLSLNFGYIKDGAFSSFRFANFRFFANNQPSYYIDVAYGYPMPKLSVPTRSGYTFCGWYSSWLGWGTQYYDANGNSVRNWDRRENNVVLYPKWTVEMNTNLTTWSKNNKFGNAGGKVFTTGDPNMYRIQMTPTGGWEQLYTQMNYVPYIWYRMVCQYSIDSGQSVGVQVANDINNDNGSKSWLVSESIVSGSGWVDVCFNAPYEDRKRILILINLGYSSDGVHQENTLFGNFQLIVS